MQTPWQNFAIGRNILFSQNTVPTKRAGKSDYTNSCRSERLCDTEQPPVVTETAPWNANKVSTQQHVSKQKSRDIRRKMQKKRPGKRNQTLSSPAWRQKQQRITAGWPKRAQRRRSFPALLFSLSHDTKGLAMVLLQISATTQAPQVHLILL